MRSLRYAAWCVVLAGCLETRLVECPDGVLCPVGTLCDTAHASCASPEQFAVCVGLAEGDSCDSGHTGVCRDGVCIRAVCGNGFLDAMELCDDGNQRSGDGCRGDCASDEACGNGIIDPREACDDANLMSRDGCDSQCIEEVGTWTVYPHAPYGLQQQQGAFDETRHRLVAVERNLIWEWDGATWIATVVTVDPWAAYYDPVRGRVQVITKGAALGVSEWTGTTLIARATMNAPSAPFGVVATYDVARAQAVVVASSNCYLLDVNGVWRVQSANNSLLSPSPIAYDAETTNVVLLANLGTHVTFDGNTWTSSQPAGVPQGQAGIAFHRGRGRLWLVGGSGTTGVIATVVEKVNGTWTPVPEATLPDPRLSPMTAYDTARGRMLVAFGGNVDQRVLEYSDHWDSFQVTGPPPSSRLAADPLRGRVIAASVDATWAWTGSWQQLASAGTGGFSVVAATYDPDRSTPVALVSTGGSYPELRAFDGSAWTTISAAAPFGAPAIVYDPTRRALITADNESTQAILALYQLDADGNWGRLSTISNVDQSESAASLAFSPRDNVIAATLTSGRNYDLDNHTWTATFSPGVGYRGITDERAGSVYYLPIGAFAGSAVWKRTASAWQRAAPLPTPQPGTAAYDPRRGEIVVFSGNVTLVYSMTSTTPVDSCTDGQDADDDHLVGCLDPDCFWACSQCPPYTTCGAP